jgi:hypothetical protein
MMISNILIISILKILKLKYPCAKTISCFKYNNNFRFFNSSHKHMPIPNMQVYAHADQMFFAIRGTLVNGNGTAAWYFPVFKQPVANVPMTAIAFTEYPCLCAAYMPTALYTAIGSATSPNRPYPCYSTRPPLISNSCYSHVDYIKQKNAFICLQRPATPLQQRVPFDYACHLLHTKAQNMKIT